MSDLKTLEVRMLGLEKDSNMAGKISDKLDASMNKMSEAVSSIQQLLAIHDTKIIQNREDTVDLYRLLEQNKKEIIDQKAEIIYEIEKGHAAISSKIDKLDDDISDKLNLLSNTVNDHDKRLRWLERITFIGLGLATLLGLLLDKLPFDKIF